MEGESRDNITKDSSVEVSGSLQHKVAKLTAIQTGRDISLKAGAKIIVEAGAELTLKAGGSFVKVDAGGVHLVGPVINLNAGGSAGSGSAYSGQLAAAPRMLAQAKPVAELVQPDIAASIQSGAARVIDVASLPTMMPSSANNTANDESVAEEKTPERILKSDLLKPSDELEKLAKRQASAYRQGNHSDEVKLLQEALIKLGFDLGKAGADGDFGSKTKTAIEQFQKSYQPSHQTHPSYSIGPVDGIVGKGTLLALDEALMDGWVYENDEMDLKWLTVPKGQLTFDAEGNDVEGDLYFSRVIHWPGNNSGITIGRGYDLGQQERVLSELNDARVDPELVSWLVSAQGLKGNDAHDFYNQIPNNIRYKGITRKQQYMLFNYTYKLMEKDVARICMKIDTLKAYHFDSSISPSDAWDSIPQIIKDVLIDLRYRGDYTPKSRRIIQRSSYKGDIDEFKKIISTKENWVNVPHDRFERRKMYVE